MWMHTRHIDSHASLWPCQPYLIATVKERDRERERKCCVATLFLSSTVQDVHAKDAEAEDTAETGSSSRRLVIPGCCTCRLSVPVVVVVFGLSADFLIIYA